tara:strand:- start:176 stop:481 length:306 start_codon:yes stop_codon:yes gene_type:complete
MIETFIYHLEVDGFSCPELEHQENVVKNSYAATIESSLWFKVGVLKNIFKYYEGFIYQEDLCRFVYFDILKKEPKLDFLRVILVGEHEGVKVISEFNSDNK